MISNTQIVPALLAFTEEEYREKVDKINIAPEFENGFVQVDFTDGQFVESKSINLETFAKYPLIFNTEAHLMVKNPLNWIEDLVNNGVKRIVVHEEAGDIMNVLARIKSLGLEAGLALNPETAVDKATPFIGTIDILLLMSVHPGKGGQAFIPETLEKVKQAAALRGQGEFKIGVDGGITLDLISGLVEAGADNLVLGESLINGDITENLEKIWEKIHA